jgi:imidazolonepropionase-like amidohydrolase
VPDIGVVRAGAVADLVLYDANPVDDIGILTSPRAVWQAGSVVAGRAPR